MVFMPLLTMLPLFLIGIVSMRELSGLEGTSQTEEHQRVIAELMALQQQKRDLQDSG